MQRLVSSPRPFFLTGGDGSIRMIASRAFRTVLVAFCCVLIFAGPTALQAADAFAGQVDNDASEPDQDLLRDPDLDILMGGISKPELPSGTATRPPSGPVSAELENLIQGWAEEPDAESEWVTSPLDPPAHPQADRPNDDLLAELSDLEAFDGETERTISSGESDGETPPRKISH